MKCTQCGNTSFIEGLSFPIRIDEYWKIDSTFKMYVCDECGHVEFYYLGALELTKELKELDVQFNNDTAELRNELEKIQTIHNEQKEKAATHYNSEVKKLEDLVQDESISVAVYKDAKAKLEELKKYNFTKKLELCGLDPKEFPHIRKIRGLEEQLKVLEQEQENKVNLVKRKYRP